MNTTEKQARLRQGAQRLRVAVWLAAVAWVCVTATAVFAPDAGAAGVLAVGLDGDGLPHAWAGAIALVSAGLVAWALWELTRMLGRIAQGGTFEPQITVYFRRFARLLALVAALQVILPALATAVLGLSEQRLTLALDLSGEDALVLLLAMVLFFVARLFDEAARLQEDSRSIV